MLEKLLVDVEKADEGKGSILTFNDKNQEYAVHDFADLINKWIYDFYMNRIDKHKIPIPIDNKTKQWNEPEELKGEIQDWQYHCDRSPSFPEDGMENTLTAELYTGKNYETTKVELVKILIREESAESSQKMFSVSMLSRKKTGSDTFTLDDMGEFTSHLHSSMYEANKLHEYLKNKLRSKESCHEYVHGIVKWFDRIKGFGFITTEEGDVFVHYSKIMVKRNKILVEGQEVELKYSLGTKGFQADEVRVLEEGKRYLATVTNWKGTFGFVTVDVLGTDVFIHYSQLPEYLQRISPSKGDRISFVAGYEPERVNKLRGHDVKMIKRNYSSCWL